jgi:hypothetical protein
LSRQRRLMPAICLAPQYTNLRKRFWLHACEKK